MVHMPKAAMDKNRDPSARHDNVRRAWQITAVKSKPQTRREEQAPHQNFGFGIFPFNARHHPASNMWFYDVCHQASLFTLRRIYPALSSGMSVASAE